MKDDKKNDLALFLTITVIAFFVINTCKYIYHLIKEHKNKTGNKNGKKVKNKRKMLLEKM